jgi:dimethylhistidine N-methyltransferase
MRQAAQPKSQSQSQAQAQAQAHAQPSTPQTYDPEFARAVIAGLGRAPKALSPKFLYDQRGSELFDRICDCADYYVTRTETSILQRRIRDIAAFLDERSVILELGSGASRKTRLLLDALPRATAYVPIDISREFLLDTARELGRAYPSIPVLPLCADFTRPWSMPEDKLPKESGRRLAFFPGSTIGNFERKEALELLKHAAATLGYGGQLLIGFDLLKPREILEPAYDDSEGITAAFNLNLLHRMRRELSAEVDPDGFRHRAIFNERESRIEMHLESLRAQEIRVLGRSFGFEPGETIHTECSHKYSMGDFEALARQAGFRKRAFWTDENEYFCVALFDAEPAEQLRVA